MNGCGMNVKYIFIGILLLAIVLVSQVQAQITIECVKWVEYPTLEDCDNYPGVPYDCHMHETEPPVCVERKYGYYGTPATRDECRYRRELGDTEWDCEAMPFRSRQECLFEKFMLNPKLNCEAGND